MMKMKTKPIKIFKQKRKLIKNNYMKKLRGNRVILVKPIKPESTIVLSPEVEEKMDRDMMKRWTHLEVYAVGDAVKDIEVGNHVYVTASNLGVADFIDIEGVQYLMVYESNIAIIW